MSADITVISPTCCTYHGHNITHNLAPMFRAAGVDWRDYQDGQQTALRLMEEASRALTEMVDDPERFRAMNPPNGWGNYEGAVAFLVRLLIDCIKHPEGRVEVSL